MKKHPQETQYIIFGLGAALGSAVGLILGSLLTYWIGEETVRAVQRGLRRLTGGDDRPNFEMLLQ
ncbi:MAG TPA: hypothetical protein VFT99_14840 [Roseiflexaceae bacterium]|jgi:hypothetical protein|nr:hypothetical protein [Roseiflexaceae bacterium]